MSASAIARATPLGPQCGKCRKRRVKCDSATPQCQRCRRDGLSCPGYATRQDTWTIATPSNIHEIVRRTNTKQSSKPLTTLTAPNDYVLPAQWQAILPLLNRGSRMAIPEDVILHQFDLALAYWSTEIRPTFMGCPIEGQPRNMTRKEWVALPRIMQHCVASVASCHQIAQGYQTKSIENNLHAHSGKALSMLRHFLKDWERAPTWSAIVLVTMMCTIEVMTTSGGPRAVWPVHFEAAWKLIEMQAANGKTRPKGASKAAHGPDKRKLSGIESSWKEGLESEMSCTYLLQIEVFSSTTCSDGSLQRRTGILEALEPGAIEGFHTTSTVDGRLVKKQIWPGDWQPGVLKGLQDRLLLTPSPCPLVVMKAIAEINDLRFTWHQYHYGDPREGSGADLVDPSNRLWSILTALLSFNAPAWVDDVAARHPPADSSASQTPPSTTSGGTSPSAVSTASTTDLSSNQTTSPTAWHRAWISLANSYRSAALVYFIRAFSTSPTLMTRFSATHRDFVSITTPLIATHRTALHREVAFLTYRYMRSFGLRIDADIEDGDEVAQQLSRFLSWPLFVDGYETIAWPSDDDDEQTASDKIERLERLGRRYGSGCMVDAAGVLRETRQTVKDRARNGRSGTWRWDDAFQWRWIFAV